MRFCKNFQNNEVFLSQYLKTRTSNLARFMDSAHNRDKNSIETGFCFLEGSQHAPKDLFLRVEFCRGFLRKCNYCICCERKSAHALGQTNRKFCLRKIQGSKLAPALRHARATGAPQNLPREYRLATHTCHCRDRPDPKIAFPVTMFSLEVHVCIFRDQ